MVETIYETPEFTFVSFLSSIGGDLSLYIGITILSFFEVAEFIIRLCITGITKKTIWAKVNCCNFLGPMHCLTCLKIEAELVGHLGTFSEVQLAFFIFSGVSNVFLLTLVFVDFDHDIAVPTIPLTLKSSFKIYLFMAKEYSRSHDSEWEICSINS